jgi:hypothetical protein
VIMGVRSMALTALILAVLLLGSLHWMNRRAIDRLNQELGSKKIELINANLVLKRQDDQLSRLLRLTEMQSERAAQAARLAALNERESQRKIKNLMSRKPSTDNLCVEAEHLIDNFK